MKRKIRQIGIIGQKITIVLILASKYLTSSCVLIFVGAKTIKKSTPISNSRSFQQNSQTSGDNYFSLTTRFTRGFDLWSTHQGMGIPLLETDKLNAFHVFILLIFSPLLAALCTRKSSGKMRACKNHTTSLLRDRNEQR